MFLKLLFLALLLPCTRGAAWTQDFGFIPGVSSWNQPWIAPFPATTGEYRSGYAYGPVQLSELGYSVRRGDTVQLDYIMDWWGLAITGTSVMSSNAMNMRYVYNDSLHPTQQQWDWGEVGRWCLRCTWVFEAGDDDPWIWIDYTGSDNFGAHLEVIQVIPTPVTARSLYSAEEKENARWWRDTTGNVANYVGGVTIALCLTGQTRYCATGTILAFLANAASNHFATIVQDPWDDWYQYPAEPNIPDPSAFGWGWTGDSEVDALMYATMVVAGYTDAANTTINRVSSCIAVNDSCQHWQQERLRDMHYQMSSWLYWNAAGHLANIRDQAWWDGVYDAYDPFNYGVQVLQGAGDYTYYLASQGY